MSKAQSILITLVACGVFSILLLSSQVVLGGEPSKKTEPQVVPEKVLKEMEVQFAMPKGLDPVAQRRLLPQRMQKVLSLGQDAEKKYPKAKNLYEVQEIMLHAAAYLASRKDSKITEKYYHEIGKKILSSNAPLENKINTDFVMLARESFVKKLTAEQIDKKLEVLMKKYKKTKGYPQLICNAVILGYQTRNQKLADKYVEILKKDCAKDPDAQKLLKMIEDADKTNGMVGKIFEAELKTLDGKALSIPKDTRGKIVVIDFWASWCPPCRRLIPQLMKFYAKFEKQGVIVIGISLDRDKAAMEKYLKDTGVPWVITYSGKGWGDPTARKYGIEGIPSVWVIAKDGKVVSTNAAGREEQIVSTLLMAKAKKPVKSEEKTLKDKNK